MPCESILPRPILVRLNDPVSRPILPLILVHSRLLLDSQDDSRKVFDKDVKPLLDGRSYGDGPNGLSVEVEGQRDGIIIKWFRRIGRGFERGVGREGPFAFFCR